MITELTDRCIAVGVPLKAIKFIIHDFISDTRPKLLQYRFEKVGLGGASIQLPPGNWSILGRPNELSEEQWKKVVTAEKTFGYPSYGQIPNGSYQWFAKPSESGQSLLKSKNVNPESVIILIKQ